MALVRLVFALAVLVGAYSIGIDYHWKKNKLVQLERLATAGHKGIVLLSEKEKKVNSILMNYKRQEYDLNEHQPGLFLPNLNFQIAKPLIDLSQVFKILKLFPKGANLHTDQEVMGSTEYLFELTFMHNLYTCTMDGLFRLKFFKTPNDECDWRLLSEIRAEDRGFDDYLRSKLILPIVSSDYTDYRTSYEDFWRTVFPIIEMVSCRPIFKKFLNQSLWELYEDNVMYAEIRSTLPSLYDYDGTTYPPIETAGLILETVREFAQAHPDFHGARLIYSPLRDVNNATAEQYVSIAEELKNKFPDFLAGFDLAGWEDVQPSLGAFQSQLKAIKKLGIPILPTVISSWFGTEKDENFFDALLLGAKRISGADAILKHPEILRLLKLKGTAIVILPIASQQFNIGTKMANHPGGYLITNNYPVVIGNGDPTLFGSKGVSYDWYEVFMGVVSRDEDLKLLKQLALNSIEHSAMPLKEKLIAFKRWYKRYEAFLDAVLKNNYSTG